MAYCTKEQVKAYVGVATDETGDDDLVDDLIVRVQAAIDTHCHRTFEASADSTRYFHAIADVGDGDWQVGKVRTWQDAEELRTLHLDEDLCQITSITNGDGDTVASSEYVTLPTNRTPWYAIRLKQSSNVAWTYDTTPEEAIEIVGRWAWSETAPDDIVQSAIRWTAFEYKKLENYDAGLERPVVSPDGVMRLPLSMPADVQAMLKPYKRL